MFTQAWLSLSSQSKQNLSRKCPCLGYAAISRMHNGLGFEPKEHISQPGMAVSPCNPRKVEAGRSEAILATQ